VNLADRRGSAIVEFVIVLPMLFALVFGIIETSLIVYDKALLSFACGEGAREGTRYRDQAPSNLNALITNAVDSYLGGSLISLGAASSRQITITGDCSAPGNTLTVQLSYQYNYLIAPNFIPGLGSGSTLQSQSVMTCE
jgi:Flp pilus assembly protein TadG